MPIPHPLPGAVLLGHGSREPGTVTEIIALEAELAAAAPEWRFTHAFLNQEPGLEAAVETLAKARCTLIRVIPLLVFTGKHLLEDIPNEIERLRGLYPFFDFELEPYLSRLPGFSGMLLGALGIDDIQKDGARPSPSKGA
jgi:sirohydrochlorin cobaltochelatase